LFQGGKEKKKKSWSPGGEKAANAEWRQVIPPVAWQVPPAGVFMRTGSACAEIIQRERPPNAFHTSPTA